jgi:hypothetical protein
MKFQLVLQFQATDMLKFDELAALEGDLIKKLSPASDVDGHDFGVGEFNIFIRTDTPEATFNAAQSVILERGFGDQYRAAYREAAKDEFVILWPEDLRDFTIA